ncbi:MAG: replicative DNA helicase [Clostridia bacterium]
MATNVSRVPPQNLEAEKSILAAMMVDRLALQKGIEAISAEHFYLERHQIIFKAMLELEDNGQAVDIITLIDKLRNMHKLEEAGGIIYLTEMSSLAPLISNVGEYCNIVKEKALLREVVSVARIMADKAFSEGQFEEILDNAERQFFELSRQRDTKSYSIIKDVVKQTFEQIEESYRTKDQITGLRTGYVDFDDITNGLQSSDLIIVAARPSMGKTALCLNFAQNIALREKANVLFFSLEMASHQLVHRMICSEARVNSQRVRKGYVEQQEWDKIGQAVATLSEAKIFIDDTPGIPILELRSKARRLKSERGVDLIIIDYLQLVTSPHRSENRQQEIAYITRQLKELARELDVPLIALAQLSRQVEQRQDKRPMLSDLRESGEIEQTADVVGFIYREDYYDENTDQKNVAEFLISKQRNGPTGKIKLMFNKQYGRFENLARRE